MPNLFIREQDVDIYKLPELQYGELLMRGGQLTLGDLHGNAMKLIYMLVKHGIITNMNDQDYQSLVKIYKTNVGTLEKNDLKEFDKLLAKLQFKTSLMVRLIGDELADRGANDYFTLKILEKLHQHRVPVEIMLSNHGVEFIEGSEKNNFSPIILGPEHSTSLSNLRKLLEKKMISSKTLLELAKKAYKPTLKAISYSLNEDESEITLYSHAAIGLNNIEELANKLGLIYKDASLSELIETIEKINNKFQEKVCKGEVHTLYSHEKILKGYYGEELIDAPFEFIMWNRKYDKINRPLSKNGYKLNFIHGHDTPKYPIPEEEQENIYNLDNRLGVESRSPTAKSFEYTVFYSPTRVLTPILSSSQDDHKQVSQSANNLDNGSRKNRQLNKGKLAEENILVTSEIVSPLVPTQKGAVNKMNQYLIDTEIKPQEINRQRKKFSDALTAIHDKEKELDLIANRIDKQIKEQKMVDENAGLPKKKKAYCAMIARSRSYHQAAEAAETLYYSLQNAHEIYLDKGDKEEFKRLAEQAIQDARNSELKNHRGHLKQILCYAAMAILMVVTVGLAYIIAGGVNYAANSQFFFLPKVNTNSINRIEELEQDLNTYLREDSSLGHAGA